MNEIPLKANQLNEHQSNQTQHLSRRAKEVLQQAIVRALDHKQRLGQYAVIYQNGHLVRLEPNEATEEDKL